jgi:16S rRNA (guanine1516-N2)-methyltransferase
MHGSSGDRWIVTTPRKRADLNPAGEHTARRLGLRFAARGETSFAALFEQFGVAGIYVETDEGPLIETRFGSIIYHENTSPLRTKKGAKPDALLRALEPRPADSVLDATIGMGCDSLVIATALDAGRVTGLESSILLADLVARGLTNREFKKKHISEAAARIKVARADHLDFLRGCADGSYDLIYFDPMFAESVEASTVMRRIRQIADARPLSSDALAEARRAARRRIVVKGRRGFFEDIEFDRIIQSGNTVFYGVIDV